MFFGPLAVGSQQSGGMGITGIIVIGRIFL